MKCAFTKHFSRHWAVDKELILPAIKIASEYGLGALDALHICAADHFDAELVSAERLTKPIYRAYSNVSSIYQDEDCVTIIGKKRR